MKTIAKQGLTNSLRKCLPSALVLSLSLSLSMDGLSQDLSVQKLFGKWNVTPTPDGNQMGNEPGTLAASEKWIIVGAPLSSEPEGTTVPIANRGALQVFNALTGAWTRKILPPVETTPSSNARFGYCCAISGDIALIGAPDFLNVTRGSVFIYNLSTGALIGRFSPENDNVNAGAPGDRFGSSIAIVGNIALIGSPADDANKGSAYVYNFVTRLQVGSKLVDSSGVAGDGFGTSVAVDGNIGIVGSPNMGSPKTGGFIAFDLTTGAELKRVIPAGAALDDKIGGAVLLVNGTIIAGANQNGVGNGKVFTHNLISSAESILTASDGALTDRFGSSLGAQNGLLLVGAPNKSSGVGAAYAFNLKSSSTTEFIKLRAADSASKAFGSSCAIVGNTAIVAASKDSTSVDNAGAVFIYKQLTHSIPLTKIAVKADYAPGAENILYNAFGDVSMNADGEFGFTSTLTGTGSNGNKDIGIFNTLGGNGLVLILKSRIQEGNALVNVISRSLVNDPSRAIFHSTLLNAGASTATTPKNNQVIYLDDGAFYTNLFRTGAPISEFPIVAPATVAGALPLSFLQIAQSRNAVAPRMAFTCSLTPTTNETVATNDSGLVIHDFTTSTREALREGAVAFSSGPIYGQFTPRVAQQDSLTVFSTAIGTVAATNQAVFARTFGGTTALIAQKGNQISDAAGAPVAGTTYASFIGESADATNTLFRGTIAGSTGTVVPAANNEALWLHNGTNYRQILRKGVDLGVAVTTTMPPYIPAAGLSGVKIAKFISFWQTNGQQLALVQLAGTGVTGANDQALILMQSNPAGKLNVLIREGQPAQGCGRATIGIINRVEVEPTQGTYLVLTTLVGAPTGTDLALFRGASSLLPVTLTTDALRHPYLILRKGQSFNNQPSKVKSFSLPTTNMTASGAGATGLGRAIRETTTPSEIPELALVVEYDNGVRQVMVGRP
ncbi:MAG: hypothetical protein NTV80_07575 [Verrucomicrobia bacterium]|nr:hypothetical protein [Verrucomicrobiota bacterium]